MLDAMPHRDPSPPRPTLTVVTVTFAAFFVVRGIAELFTLDYSHPASYRGDWGGPSLLGVLATHSGPAVVVLAYVAYSAHRLRARRKVTR